MVERDQTAATLIGVSLIERGNVKCVCLMRKRVNSDNEKSTN